MQITVIDASAIAAVLFVEPMADMIDARLAGARLVAPALLFYEVANVCLTKIRRDPSRREELLKAFGKLASVEIAIEQVAQAAALLLAARMRLSFYDASYLWLARSLDAELVTLDRRLEAAHAAVRGA
jgi:predicted nucleic acid-binding protein